MGLTQLTMAWADDFSTSDTTPVPSGNDPIFLPQHVSEIPDSPLKGKNLIFLGSSITLGEKALSNSMADYIGKKHAASCIKEAEGGTTMADHGGKSYVHRLLTKINKDLDLDGLIVQLSTNDASQCVPLGEIAKSDDINTFDTKTITGAIEYIIAYSKMTWNCPVVFFTSPRFESPAYDAMVNRLYEIQKKWNIGIIDLWNDPDFNILSESQRKQYMSDTIHPTMAGYLLWWTPRFEAELMTLIQ